MVVRELLLQTLFNRGRDRTADDGDDDDDDNDDNDDDDDTDDDDDDDDYWRCESPKLKIHTASGCTIP